MSCLLALLTLPAALEAVTVTAKPLREGWRVQSACKLQAAGDSIAAEGFSVRGWLKASVPNTVLAAQVAGGVFPDPYYGMNLRRIPGGTYPSDEDSSSVPIPPDSPYHCGWWYRKEFTVPAADAGRTLWLHFGGINYRADIWVNGKKIADKSQVVGMYRTYDFNVTADLVPGKPNVLAVETFAPTLSDLSNNWVDWNPMPPDKDMGLWRGVELVTSGPVSLRSPMVTTHFTDASLKEAALTVYAELHNATDKTVHGDVAGTVGNIPLQQSVNLAPHEDKTVVFTPKQFPQLNIRNPRVWWPYQMGTPSLENLTLRFNVNGKVSDEKSVQFGIREMTSELTDKGYRLFRVNGKPILIRGAGWSPDMLLREDPSHLRDEIRLVRDMHLNTIRLEGKMETEDFFHLTDQQGILVMLGWCCCDVWQHEDNWTPENYSVAAESLRSQMLRIRHHASLLVWLNGSDRPPLAGIERAYLRIESETHWPNPTLSSANSQSTTVSGKSGVKMTGPYYFEAPSYWYIDSHYGGAYGFNTETTSVGQSIPNLASLKKFIPSDQMWPPNDTWGFHAGNGDGSDLKMMADSDDAMNQIFTKPRSAEEYVRLSQTMAYDGERAMFEAYSRNKYTSTGVIQWMLNNAWPSMIWHLFDYYLDPDGGYFGTKKACEPLHIQYSYDDHSIVIVNSTYQAASHLMAAVHVYDFKLKPLFSQKKQIDLAADSSVRVIPIADSVFQSGSKIYFVDLTLQNASGETVSRNFYWVPAKLATFDWAHTTTMQTPAIQREDLSALLALPKAEIEAQVSFGHVSGERTIELTLHNPSKALAFQISAFARTSSGGLIAPVLWSDNYIELMPGERRKLTAILPKDAPADTDVLLSGWNIASQKLQPRRAANAGHSHGE